MASQLKGAQKPQAVVTQAVHQQSSSWGFPRVLGLFAVPTNVTVLNQAGESGEGQDGAFWAGQDAACTSLRGKGQHK
jgi:hypothetical protein